VRIAVDARVIHTSTGRYVERLLRHLQQIDRGNTYFVLLRREDFKRWNPAAPNVTKVLADQASYSFAEQLQLARLLYRLDVDLVHFTMPQQPLLYVGRRVTTVHDLTLLDFVNPSGGGLLQSIYVNRVKPFVFRGLMRWVVHHSTALITPTEYGKRQLTQRYGVAEQRVFVTLEAADELANTARPHSPLEGRRFLLAVGNAYPYKNLDRLVAAFRRLQSQHADLHLVLVGRIDSYYKDLRTRIEREGVTNVHLTGFVDDDELVWLYRNAEVYVFPSLSEGFGLPGLEAMIQGAPVVAAGNTCLPEVYAEAALYFNPLDVEDMASVIASLLEDPERCGRLASAGRERAARFSWRRMAEQTLDVYTAVGRATAARRTA
jgi:glycosyltransferase involved in cell wall biosynthesis